ncbi:BREX-1 system adenine-specific DNA-methyltransferase PglX [uncultured Desulfobacter sp.]|uniref:BREX-1 system adenine-specific DNA-methyltransferase PglX n=1 Tax=uncultured Desulfobacter sp. TaxID=240139 RepID=UPI0029C8AD1E|nr:BREX-1 system adenine-specific DNA-methyltransferase PglX [uncultured Desulfobacter sp.]
MDTAQIKAYAPQARKDFINAVTERAARFGIHGDDNFDPVEFKGDTAIIGSQVFTQKGGELREKLVAKVRQIGFQMFIRSSAYTWFNRFVAIRYMELHGFLDHGFRVLSHPNGSDTPEVLEYATEVDLPGLDKEKVLELRLAGDKDNELYRMLVIAQCNALHNAMPFLFDKIDNEAELLLPDNLLHTHSPVRKMVSDIDESLWEDVEIIGWIYQFYISEKKDEVIGKVVKSEDIPAATQLFTPNWIVKYMVQNTLGRMWMATYPESSLKSKMEYYIEPAEQEPEVQAEIDATTPKELNPEELTFLDPACGSGHILVEAYDILKEIYLERGYRTRDIPRLILSKNIYGLDIDDRAAQLACFAVLMKARKDDRRLFSRDDLTLNVMSIVETKEIDKDKLLDAVSRRDGGKGVWTWINELVELFKHAKTFGALISISDQLAEKFSEIDSVIKSNENFDEDIFNFIAGTELQSLRPIIDQAKILAKKYDCVATNPPYMGRNGMNLNLKLFAKEYFPNSKQDLYGVFIERLFDLSKDDRRLSVMSPITWLFLKSYENLRKDIISKRCFLSLIKPEYHSFFDSAYVPICCFTLLKKAVGNYKAIFIDLSEFYGAPLQPVKAKEAILDDECEWRFEVKIDDFKIIPTNPFVYSINSSLFEAFAHNIKVGADAKKGTTTGDNNRFLRLWSEISMEKFSVFGGAKWYPMTKGGPFRKWYGNFEYVINWENDGYEIRNFRGENGKLRSRPQNLAFNFKEGITWNDVTVSEFSARYVPKGFVFNAVGPMIFGKDIEYRLCMLNSKVNTELLKVLCPTMKFEVGAVSLIPIGENNIPETKSIALEAIEISKFEWDSYERSWDFLGSPLLSQNIYQATVKKSYDQWESVCRAKFKQLQYLEGKSNQLFINEYKLKSIISFDVSEEKITIKLPSIEDEIKQLFSYAIGCMMGRYSLDNPGLIYAHSENIGFDQSKFKSFPADDDGIIPIMDMNLFDDDATKRFVEFIKTAWPSENLDKNLKFIADSLKPKTNESPEDTIRRYLSTTFFKDHMKMYKKRPIYWLFSSGKQKAFECLVYLHRYNKSTLSRMRSNYVTPLQGNISARIEFLDHEKDAATTASTQKKIQKQIDVLKKKQVELKTFDDELRHYADMRIPLDLDDGVKVNYGKFGNLLAQKKAITGKS